MYLVACSFQMADGSKHSGFATPADDPHAFGLMQPQLFDEREVRHAFWLGMFPDQEAVKRFRMAFGKPWSSIFPIAFECLPNLTHAHCSGTIHGFMKACGASGEVLPLHGDG